VNHITNGKKHCFTHNHMTCRQYGLWTRVRELQSKFGFIYFDGDDLAQSFKKTSRDVIYDDCKTLILSGWFEEKGRRNRKKDGSYESRKIAAITHKEWVVKYPNQCPQPVAPQQLDTLLTDRKESTSQLAQSNQPVGKQRLTSRLIAIDQSLPTNKDLVLSSNGSKQTGFKADGVLADCRGCGERASDIAKRMGITPSTPSEDIFENCRRVGLDVLDTTFQEPCDGDGRTCPNFAVVGDRFCEAHGGTR